MLCTACSGKLYQGLYARTCGIAVAEVSVARLQGLKGYEHFVSAVMTKLAELATASVVVVSVTHI